MRQWLCVLLISNFVLSCTTVRKRTEAPKPTAKKSSSVSAKKTKHATSVENSADKSVKSQITATETAHQKIQRLEEEGRFTEALQELVSLSVTAPTPQAQESFRLKAIEITENKLDEETLQKISSSSDYGFLRGHAYYKLGELSYENQDKSSARKYFASVVDYLPGTDLAARAEEILAQLEAAKYVQTKTIGVVLPLSGKNAAVGQRALRGVQMGLGMNLPGANFKLAVMDSEGNPDNARRGVERLVKEDNVVAIIGSLLSRTAPAVAAKADELGVPTIALSQKSGLTDIGTTVFRNSLTSEMQVRYLVRVAMDEMGMRKFAVLYPNDAYGVEYTNIFWDEVLARGGQITAAQSYTNKETDFRFPIQRLVGTYYGEARLDEFRSRAKEASITEKKRGIRHSNAGDNLLPPIVDFDAIFIPDSAKALGQISAMLAYNDVRGVKLLGTNLWNTRDIAKRAGNAASNLVFVDSYSSGAGQHEKPRFISEYKTFFNEEPSLIEIQAYDAALMLRQLIVSGASSREELARRLSNIQNFPGALGNLSINSEREIERPLMALTIERGEVTPLKSQRN